MRAQLLDMMWETDKRILHVTKEQYVASFEGWDVKPFYVNDEVVGATVTKGAEFHFETFGKSWRLTRAHIRQCLSPILNEYGFVKTRTLVDDTRQHRFNLLLGFVPEGEDEKFVHYKLEKLQHV